MEKVISTVKLDNGTKVSLTSFIKKVYEERDKVERSLEVLRSQINGLKTVFQSNNDQIKLDMGRLWQQVKDLETKSDLTSKKIPGMPGVRVAPVSEVDQLKKIIEEKERAITSLLKQVEEMQNNKSDAFAAKDEALTKDLEEKTEIHNAELAELHTKLMVANKKLSEKDEIIARLNGDLTSERKSSRSLKKKVDEVERRHKNKDLDLTAYRNAYECLNDSLSLIIRDAELAQKTSTELKDENEIEDDDDFEVDI